MTDEQFNLELEKRFKKARTKVKRELKSHFKKDGWDIDVFSQGDQMRTEALGLEFNCMYKRMLKLAEELGVELKFNDRFNMVFHDKDYIPVSYNNKTNKIHVGEFKDTTDKTWTFLGRL